MALGVGMSATSACLVLYFFLESTSRSTLVLFAVYGLFPAITLIAVRLG
jgi:hypothetical protein